MELNLGEIYGTANRIYNNNPSDKPLQVRQEKKSNSIDTSVNIDKTSNIQNNLQNKISNNKDIKAIVNDENLLSNEDSLKKKVLENVLGQIKGSEVNIHPNSISLNSALFKYEQSETVSNSYMQYGGVYSTESDKALGHIYSHYAKIEEETSFSMSMEFTVKTPNEEFNININISYTESFKKELYEENLILKEQVAKDKSVGYHHSKNLYSEIKNTELELDDVEKAYASNKNEYFTERVETRKGDSFTNTISHEKDSSMILAFLDKEKYENIAKGEIEKPIINFDKDIEDKTSLENINLIFDAAPFNDLNLKNNNGFLELADTIKPKEKPLYLRIWEEKIEKEKVEEAQEKKALEAERIEERKETRDNLLAVFQEDIGFIYLSNMSSQSKEFTFTKDLETVQFSQDEKGLPLTYDKTDISI